MWFGHYSTKVKPLNCKFFFAHFYVKVIAFNLLFFFVFLLITFDSDFMYYLLCMALKVLQSRANPTFVSWKGGAVCWILVTIMLDFFMNFFLLVIKWFLLSLYVFNSDWEIYVHRILDVNVDSSFMNLVENMMS